MTTTTQIVGNECGRCGLPEHGGHFTRDEMLRLIESYDNDDDDE